MTICTNLYDILLKFYISKYNTVMMHNTIICQWPSQTSAHDAAKTLIENIPFTSHLEDVGIDLAQNANIETILQKYSDLFSQDNKEEWEKFHPDVLQLIGELKNCLAWVIPCGIGENDNMQKIPEILELAQSVYSNTLRILEYVKTTPNFVVASENNNNKITKIASHPLILEYYRDTIQSQYPKAELIEIPSTTAMSWLCNNTTAYIMEESAAWSHKLQNVFAFIKNPTLWFALVTVQDKSVVSAKDFNTCDRNIFTEIDADPAS